MSLDVKWPAHIGVLRVSHNAHHAFHQPVEEYWREQSAFEPGPGILAGFISHAEKAKSFEKDELWELEYQPNRHSKPLSIWASSFDALIDHVNDPENSHG